MTRPQTGQAPGRCMDAWSVLRSWMIETTSRVNQWTNTPIAVML